MRRTGVCWALLPLLAVFACRSGGGALPDAASDSVPPDETVAEKRCGDDPNVYFSAYSADDLAEFSECTVLVGRFQEDSVRDLVDLAALRNVRRVEGAINIFRSPGFLTLHGLENLEVVEGDLFIHLNDNLTTVAALAKLRTVTGNLFIHRNFVLPQADVDAVAADITVGGTKTLGPQVWE